MSKCRSTDPIGIFDSGFGGLSVFKEVQERLPKESLLFFADTARVPYGECSTEEIITYSLEAASVLNQLGVKMLIIACHTASICALDVLKKHCSMPVIGINEVFGQLLKEKPPKKSLLLGTTKTIESGYYPELLPTTDIVPCACGDFVMAIEQGIENNTLLPLLLEKHLMQHAQKPFDSLLLACTHFPFIKEHILSTLGQDLNCLDPALQLTTQIQHELSARNLLADEHHTPYAHFYTTGDPQHFAERGGSLIGMEMSPENVFELIKDDEEALL